MRWTILSGTKLQKNHSIETKLCDFLVRREIAKYPELHVVAELKSRVAHISEILEQLQRGAAILEKAHSANVRLAAVLIKNRGIGTDEYRILRRTPITYRGAKVFVSVENNGYDLGKLKGQA